MQSFPSDRGRRLKTEEEDWTAQQGLDNKKKTSQAKMQQRKKYILNKKKREKVQIAQYEKSPISRKYRTI